ncbi:hypothetical protein TVAG_070290 [Trichomonas vaginalis G3]|uniref:Uncharacterized protein n=1 Tax=Trichomonas vaginalis (strain ATCC PRA-98 / G3) TaxID=412133 RepID=A2D7T3_TRIV3|nr:hypothetical protein TVAGG3_1044710 [Trichomonas vaginalis G3]EAY23366.1 hypothetical protein TVAG_070290 [Trichomonas vaginalis G3]KAI5493781.1 hypothetical protein TVAGG3_1044710 [Trichomonas vaginalis G3]|eukprot:XP_001584352.1 hypothetical protein [Trichomonas vaginalis G3]
MSILQERFIVIFQDARNLTFDIKLEDFLKSLSLELLTVTIAWIILHFVSDKLPSIVIRILGLLISLPNGTEKIRIFYFTFNYLNDIDPRVLMILCISFCFAPEILEILIRRVTHQRAMSKYTKLRNLAIGFLIFLIAFQFLMKGSIISGIFGRVRPSLVLQSLNFILPIYYIYLFLK